MANVSTREKSQLAEAICAREGGARAARSNWENLWQQISRYVLPMEATFTEKVTAGHERHRGILDSTGPRSLELFASFLHTLMNNPAQQWFNLEPEQPTGGILPVSSAKFLESAAESTLTHLVRARIYDTLHQVFLAAGAFGTAVLFVEWMGGLRLRQFHLGDCVLEEGDAGGIDMIHRQFMRTPRQIVQRWGEQALTERVRAQAHSVRGAEIKIRFIHSVFPTDEPFLGTLLPPQIQARGHAFASVWVDAESKTLVDVGTFLDNPYIVYRWYKTRDEVYGRSPAMTALPAIRMANRMMDTIIRGAEKLVDPPLLLREGSMLSPVRMFPGGISFSDGDVTPQPLIPPGASRIEMGNELLQQVQRDIEKAFFVPFFVDPTDTVKTATQVLQESGERNRAVSPMLMRAVSELYDPALRRVVGLLDRKGQLPEPPEDLRGTPLAIRYSSPLIASQREAEGLSMMRWFEMLAPMHGVDPGIFDGVDPAEWARLSHRASGAPAKLLRSTTAMKRVQAARAEQAQQAEQMTQLQAGAGAAADLMTAAAKGKAA